jgi:hypothetical protein
MRLVAATSNQRARRNSVLAIVEEVGFGVAPVDEAWKECMDVARVHVAAASREFEHARAS